MKTASKPVAAARSGAGKKLSWPAVLSRRTPIGSIYRVDPLERVAIIKRGVPAKALVVLCEDMGISQEKLYVTIGLPRATVARKLRNEQVLNPDESERVVGIARLVGLVDKMVRDSGRREGFAAARWVASWLDRPQAALGGRRPGELMDTVDGRGMVADLVSQMQSGAYA